MRRRRLMTAAVAGILAVWCVFCVVGPRNAYSVPATVDTVGYTVRPGDTLWDYAEMITPQGGDVSVSVDELMRLNGLDSAALRTGQHIVVPKR